jgi:hypothetical protein
MGSSLYHLFVGLPGGEYLKELKATVGHYCINARENLNELQIRKMRRRRSGTAYPSGAHEFTPVCSGIRVTRSFVPCVML